MARKKEHEDHVNHEAWAIPYGDLVTLLLAFFVVMYAVSSLNEGKYRTLADSLAEAFGGPQKSISPIQLGKVQPRGSSQDRSPPMQTAGAKGSVAPTPLRDWPGKPQIVRGRPSGGPDKRDAAGMAAREQLATISVRVEEALAELIEERLVTLRRNPAYLEIEIRSDILFASGSAAPTADAIPALHELGAALKPFPNPLRIEGHTDDIPIRTVQFPSNWELSAARAASVLRLFAGEGVDQTRMAVLGFGEVQPIRDNGTSEGRTANRRVTVVVLAAPDAAQETPDRMAEASPSTPTTPTSPAPAAVTAPARSRN